MKPRGPISYQITKGANMFWNPFRWLRECYHARLRKIDIEVLWPACREESKSLADAKLAFLRHTEKDFAWRALSDVGRRAVVEGLR